ncbi:hypothetical protein GcC1_c13076o16 [Golovinomyces cichoracearum]|uniref:Secreted protein n=1 Tax=Golovinomyces cichoracearum TaxID=62708 RepID=A0A420J3Z7_9PEZI|nr:hypothetical protein GcC1_c13076o16 [Golovinomyces cichoracearum]
MKFCLLIFLKASSTLASDSLRIPLVALQNDNNPESQITAMRKLCQFFCICFLHHQQWCYSWAFCGCGLGQKLVSVKINCTWNYTN